jgi:4-hydroxyacetophenone monooxygenase
VAGTRLGGRLDSATAARTVPPDTSDEAIEDFVTSAHLPSLLAALAHAGGDLSILRPELSPDPRRLREPQGGMSRSQRLEARALAVEALKDLRDRVTPVPARSDPEVLCRIVEFLLGEPLPDSYVDLVLEELAVSGEDLRSPGWHKDDVDPEREFRVAVIGAGMSGLLAAYRLQAAGVRYVILEKDDDVGGTWWENQYPGCRVDVPNHLYSYSFAQRDDWPEHYSTEPALLDYFRRCAHDLGIEPNIRFGTEVVAAEFCEKRGGWQLTVRPPDGAEEVVHADALISAVGQLNRPSLPDIAGRDTFGGPSFHSARWDHSVDLRGKRVAVVGTAASGIQLIPRIADEAAELYVYQRTPNWFMPVPEYHDPMPAGMQWLLRHVPFYNQWYRFWLFWRLTEGALPAARVDPAWPKGGESVSLLNEELRRLLVHYLEAQFADAPELLSQVVPHYPPLAKRILLDNGTWADTLKRDRVHLVTDAIERVTPHGIVTGDGRQRDVDVIVYATGFEASHFLAPMRITGRGGLDLHQHWGDDARAYLGITVPGFPNLFCLYGPNTNLVANGSIIFFSECGVRYTLGCLRLLLERRSRALDCRSSVYEDYNARIDEGNDQMVWGVASVNTWYRNSRGRITQNWPFTLLEYWERTLEPDPAHYELL